LKEESVRTIAAGGTVAAIVGAAFLAGPAWIASLNSKACDLVSDWSAHGRPSERILMVDIDEKSLARFGQWPWSRDVLGGAVDRIYDGGAVAVVLDMMFPEEDRGTPSSSSGGRATNDSALAAALSRGPSVVGYAFRFDGSPAEASAGLEHSLSLTVSAGEKGAGRAFFHATGVLPTIPALARACAITGFLNAPSDSDGKLRVIPLIIEYGGRYYPSIALAAWIAYRGVSTMQLETGGRGALRLRLNGRAVPLEGPSSMRIRFRGEQRTFTSVSAADVLAGTVPINQLRGKIVVVGGTALGLSTTGAVHPHLPSSEVQATAIDNLLEGDFIRRPTGAYVGEALLAIAATLATTTLLMFTNSPLAFLAILPVAIGVWPGCVLMLSTTGILISPLPTTAALAANLALVTLLKYRRERLRADRTAQDLVSAHEETQEVIERNESRYERLVENINDAIIMDDIEGRLVFANRRFREWFGVSEAAIGNVAAEEYVAPEWRPLLHDQHRRQMSGESTPDHLEYEGVRADGSRIWIEALITPVEEHGRTVGTQYALRDITERKRLEAQFRQAQKMESLGRLAGAIAHDFNNLLTVINGYTELLLMGSSVPDPERATVEQIRSAGARAAELTQQLLAFSRKQVVQPKLLDLNTLAAEVKNLMRRLVGEDIELVSVLSPGLGMVMADAGQINQVLMNLLVNGRDSMPQGGRLTIETSNAEVDESFSNLHPEVAPGSYVRLSVSDTGIGMSEEIKRQIFEPFFTTKEQGKGTGLGLATVYGIVRQNRGGIWVWSEPGRGSVFHVYLPRVKAGAVVEETESARLGELGGTETVLLVEDEDAVRQLAGDILKRSGYRVLQANSGPDAIALVQRYPETIHLLLTDVILPQMNGQALADALQAARPGLKVLYTSGYPAEVVGRGQASDRQVAYLPKPYSPEALVASVRKALAERT
jgi:PAS domain S-box-containing protein